MSECVIWSGHIKPDGYGQTCQGAPAHRAAYVEAKGAIPEGLEIDHLCRNRACVNPDHMEPVTHAENIRRSVQFWGSTNQTHCKAGHEYTLENTYFRPSNLNGRRDCRACIRERVRKYKARRRAA